MLCPSLRKFATYEMLKKAGKKSEKSVFNFYRRIKYLPNIFHHFWPLTQLSLGVSTHELCPVQGFPLLKGRKRLSCRSVFGGQVENESDVTFFMSALTFYKKICHVTIITNEK